MKLKFKKENLKYLGSEVKTSKKGNNYSIITFLDGGTTHTILSRAEVPNYEFGEVFSAEFSLDYNVKYPGVSILRYE